MFIFESKMLLPLMIKSIGVFKLYKLKMLKLLKLLKSFLYITIVFWKLLLSCIPPHVAKNVVQIIYKETVKARNLICISIHKMMLKYYICKGNG
jgi:hypothetical protein